MQENNLTKMKIVRHENENMKEYKYYMSMK